MCTEWILYNLFPANSTNLYLNSYLEVYENV